MNNTGVLLLFGVMLIWVASVLFAAPETTCEPPKPAPVPIASAPMAAPESLAVTNDRPTVMIVADLSQGFGAKWLSDDAEKLRAKGWEVRTVDVRGLNETRFYVNAGGQWRAHAGQMSLSGLKAMIAK